MTHTYDSYDILNSWFECLSSQQRTGIQNFFVRLKFFIARPHLSIVRVPDPGVGMLILSRDFFLFWKIIEDVWLKIMRILK